ncbi:hypothetical protein [uncultured Methylobacterium sp.]|jgi:hypothetical protein|uniref:hypothetical protein n=1 Tax=uncultured Methylobacterium sp. TaxID=157278 RepID=UPI002639185B|nr:hypothetical protein [uncultured Methylobacterium sp.]
MMKADKVKEAPAVTAGAPAALPPSDASQLHLQGGAAMLDLLRTIAECAKAAHQMAQRQTELLETIERNAFEQAVQGRSRPH